MSDIYPTLQIIKNDAVVRTSKTKNYLDLSNEHHIFFCSLKNDKKMQLKFSKSLKTLKFRYFWKNIFLGGLSFVMSCVIFSFFSLKCFCKFRRIEPIHCVLFEQNWSIFRYFIPFLARNESNRSPPNCPILPALSYNAYQSWLLRWYKIL